MGVAIRLQAPLDHEIFVAKRLTILDIISGNLPIILYRFFDGSAKYVSLRLMVPPNHGNGHSASGCSRLLPTIGRPQLMKNGSLLIILHRSFDGPTSSVSLRLMVFPIRNDGVGTAPSLPCLLTCLLRAIG